MGERGAAGKKDFHEIGVGKFRKDIRRRKLNVEQFHAAVVDVGNAVRLVGGVGEHVARADVVRAAVGPVQTRARKYEGQLELGVFVNAPGISPRRGGGAEYLQKRFPVGVVYRMYRIHNRNIVCNLPNIVDDSVGAVPVYLWHR